MLVALKRGVQGPGRYVYGKLVFDRVNGGQSNTVHEVDDDAGAALINSGHFEIRTASKTKPTAPPARGDRPASSRAKAAEAFPVTFPEDVDDDDLEPEPIVTEPTPEKPASFVAQPTPAEVGNPVSPRANLEEMTFGELVGYAKSRGVALKKTMKKPEVVNAILASAK